MYGYRTGKSKQSQKAWDLAQPFAAKQMLLQGILFLILGSFALLLPTNMAEWVEPVLTMLPIGIILFGVGYMIYKTDRYIENNL